MPSGEGQYELTSEFRNTKKDLDQELHADLQRDLGFINRDFPEVTTRMKVRGTEARHLLKAGVSEDGQWSETKMGTPQGFSPLLANVYLHYVFDLWVEAWRKKVANGDAIVVRY